MTLQQASTGVVAFCLFLVGGAIAVQAQSDHVSYDKHGRVTTIRYSNGQEVRYEYDDRNNLTTVTNVVSSVDEAVETPAVWIHPNPASDHTTVTVPAVAGTAVTFTLVALGMASADLGFRLLTRRTGLSHSKIWFRLVSGDYLVSALCHRRHHTCDPFLLSGRYLPTRQ